MASPVVVVDLLDEGSWTLTHNRRVRNDAERLARESRDLLLTYRSHRVLALSGGSGTGVDSAATLGSLLRSSPGEPVCDACLAFACSVSLATMRELTGALLHVEPHRFQRASTCASCRRTVPSIVCAK